MKRILFLLISFTAFSEVKLPSLVSNGMVLQRDMPVKIWGNKGKFTVPKQFSGLLKTYLGPVEDESGLAYMRPETAQGIFINFQNVATTARKKPPFGIGQIGKSFRNEITPGNFIFRTREFEQMEMESLVSLRKESWKLLIKICMSQY